MELIRHAVQGFIVILVMLALSLPIFLVLFPWIILTFLSSICYTMVDCLWELLLSCWHYLPLFLILALAAGIWQAGYKIKAESAEEPAASPSRAADAGNRPLWRAIANKIRLWGRWKKIFVGLSLITAGWLAVDAYRCRQFYARIESLSNDRGLAVFSLGQVLDLREGSVYFGETGVLGIFRYIQLFRSQPREW